MRIAVMWPWVLLFMLASAWSGIQLKIAAEHTGRAALGHFIFANVVGVLCPIALTFALKHANPNVVYALCFGGAFALLQIASLWFFKQPLSPWQWTGVCAVGLGILLLQVRA